ncbi:MAG: hypothetical protein JNL41_01270 [Phenylobacterium sp.]|uniref:hypothetical protein n=1 Tax=Phenylobacterium sp. TaxID=1871053 RepID=UPI001A5A0AD2|nr:hypothetical protein [Phenylobacterium sp.]MBL8552878.1 hypothetical protein [Phenylobacterium sp.]
MTERLDELVARLNAVPTDRSLDGLDDMIGHSIALRRREARASAALTPVRLASLGLALAMGLTAGGAIATSEIAAPHPYATFSSVASLAPSTLLEGGR